LVACVGVLSLSSNAFALGLGDPSVASVLGQPLQLTVPLVVDPGTELAAECVRIVPGPRDSIPSLNTGRITIEPEHGQLRIESLLPITEPALRVIVEAGCKERIRREYALLVDPPAVTMPQSGSAPGRPEPGIGLGMAQITAVIGQRLSIRVPAVGADASRLTADCVHLADPISSEGAPVLRQATIRVVPQPGGAVIEVATPDPVTEPAVRLALDVGCRDPLRREYAILLGLPTLAASNAGAGEAATEAALPQPEARPPAKAAVKPPKVAAAAAPAPVRAVPVRPTETAAKTAPPPRAAGSDRLVLGSAQDSIRPAQSGDAAGTMPDANAEMLKRIETMSRQIEALETQLAVSRQRQQELERQASELRERWTWLMGALGALLLVGALTVLLWRQRSAARPSTWEGVVHEPSPVTEPRPKAVAARAHTDFEAPGIGGRATMPPARTIIGATTEPSIHDDRNTHITVTELHDTVQVIKELYATVLERNTSSSAGGQKQRPLDLDLRTPTGARSTDASSTPSGQPASADSSKSGSTGLATRAAHEQRFTELPTEAGLDLDLSSALIPMQAAPFDLLEEAGSGATESPAPVPAAFAGASAAAQAVRATEALAKEVELAPAPEAAAKAAPADEELAMPAPAAEASAKAAPAAEATAKAAKPGRDTFHDEQLTQTPTEVLIDIDVGTTSGFSGTIGRPTASRVVPLQRPESDRTRSAAPPFEPIDLQLDLSQPESRNKRRGEKSA
jgi:hypothetical protein